MTHRTLLGVARGACIGFAATVAVPGWRGLLVLVALVGAFVLTDALHDRQETR